MPNLPKNDFIALTFLDLETWAGQKIVNRGKSYQRSGYVTEIGMTKDGRLVGWVEGTRRYATMVSCTDLELDSQCTCPYWDTCKHAVATVLEYLNMIKERKAISIIHSNDRRLSLIKNMENDQYDDEFEALDDGETIKPPDIQPSAKSRDLETLLRSKTKEELIQLLVKASENDPNIESELLFEASLSSKSVKKLVQTIRQEIECVNSDPGWWDGWRQEEYFPDYSRVRNGLQKLLENGHADEVVILGDLLFREGTIQIEQSDDEGATAGEVTESLDIVFEALKSCSLPIVDKMEKAVNFELEDSYGLCDGIETFWGQPFTKTVWNELTDRLMPRLDNMNPNKDEDNFSGNYHRDNLTDKIICALENAGREKEVIPLCMVEAENTNSYTRLIKLLRQAGMNDEAETWIRKGYSATRDKWAGIASELQHHLLEIREEKRDWTFAAALRADDFFESPSLTSFLELKTSAKKTKCWSEVKKTTMRFLEKGISPDISARSISNTGIKQWPLPATGFPVRKKYNFQDFPLTKTLIEIALDDKNVDEVVHWYEIHCQKNKSGRAWWGENLHDQVASAIVDTYPDKAIAIWKSHAEGHISRTNPKEYFEAAKYLKNIKKVLENQQRTDEWKRYIAAIREENRRKRRLMEILDALEGKPICE